MTFHPFDPAISYNTEAYDRPPCRICGRERVANPDHFKTEETNTMSAKDFHVTPDIVKRVLAANAVTREQNPAEQFAIFGCVAIEHDVDDRVDLLTYDLAYQIAGRAFEEQLLVDPIATVRQIAADLEPKTRHWPTRSITFWENVGLQYVGPAHLIQPYVPATVDA